jgi:hypothetical protein
MKTATFLALLLALPVPAAYSQAAGAYAGAASQMQGSAQAAGRDQGAALSQATGANASSTQKSVAGSANESSAAVANAGKTGAGTAQASNLSAELTQKVDSKHAKVGDQVVARTTSATQLEPGTKLPKGTRLMGKVTEVQAKSGAQHDGHLAFAFDRAVMRDGHEIPIHTTLQSISAPADVAAMGSTTDEFGPVGPVSAPVMASGSGGGSARSGGGLLGGGGGAVAPAGGLVGGATSSVATMPGRAAGLSEGTLDQSERTLHQSEGTLHQGAGMVTQTGGSAFAAVHNLPGVSASTSASGSSMLDAAGKNVELSSGTQMVFNVSKN